MRTCEAVAILLPGVAWSMKGNDLTTLKLPQGVVAPTQGQVDATIAAKSYQDKRKAEYPPLTNLADALVHQDMGDGGAALKAYCVACEAVKAKYPKPS